MLVSIMAKGLLNLWMLKILAEGEVSGYDIIKKVSELTGRKPSTGSVYPLLKSMENKGWISGKKVGSKTVYKITDSGREVVKSHSDLKEYYSEKIHESICLAHETFDDLHVAFFNNRNLLAPLTQEVFVLLSEGIEFDKINKIIQNAREELRKLKK
jgi:DNA-binding PadR family transcriptional regulator